MLIELDDRRRTSFGKIGHKEHRLYRTDVSPDGTITLTPAVVATERELAVLRSGEAMERITSGIDEARAGRTSNVDWSVFGDLDADD